MEEGKYRWSTDRERQREKERERERKGKRKKWHSKRVVERRGDSED